MNLSHRKSFTLRSTLLTEMKRRRRIARTRLKLAKRLDIQWKYSGKIQAWDQAIRLLEEAEKGVVHD